MRADLIEGLKIYAERARQAIEPAVQEQLKGRPLKEGGFVFRRAEWDEVIDGQVENSYIAEAHMILPDGLGHNGTLVSTAFLIQARDWDAAASQFIAMMKGEDHSVVARPYRSDCTADETEDEADPLRVYVIEEDGSVCHWGVASSHKQAFDIFWRDYVEAGDALESSCELSCVPWAADKDLTIQTDGDGTMTKKGAGWVEWAKEPTYLACSEF